MSGGNIVGTQFGGILQKRFEFYLPVAQHIGIGRASSFILLEKVGKYIIPIFGRKICGMQLNTQCIADRLCVLQIFFRGAVFGAVIFFPILHEQPFDLESALLQQMCSNG